MKLHRDRGPVRPSVVPAILLDDTCTFALANDVVSNRVSTVVYKHNNAILHAKVFGKV